MASEPGLGTAFRLLLARADDGIGHGVGMSVSPALKAAANNLPT